MDPEIVKAAEGLEAVFIDHMMQQMRKTVPKVEGDLESPASGMYRAMLDSEYAERAAKTGGIGLADQVIAYMDSQRYNSSQGASPQRAARAYTQSQAAVVSKPEVPNTEAKE